MLRLNAIHIIGLGVFAILTGLVFDLKNRDPGVGLSGVISSRDTYTLRGRPFSFLEFLP